MKLEIGRAKAKSKVEQSKKVHRKNYIKMNHPTTHLPPTPIFAPPCSHRADRVRVRTLQTRFLGLG